MLWTQTKWVYVQSYLKGIVQYSFDSKTGVVGPEISATPVAYGLNEIKFDRTGHFLIGVSQPYGFLYSIDPTNGTLSLVKTFTLL